MSELFTYGSVRGAAGDGGPYRDTGNSREINSFSFRCGAVQLIPKNLDDFRFYEKFAAAKWVYCFLGSHFLTCLATADPVPHSSIRAR